MVRDGFPGHGRQGGGCLRRGCGGCLTLKSVKRRRERLAPLSYKNYLYEKGANLALATYQRTGAGRSRQRVAYDSRRIADIEEWLTTKLGPLAHFEAVDQSTQAGAETTAPADVSEPAPEPVGEELPVAAAAFRGSPCGEHRGPGVFGRVDLWRCVSGGSFVGDDLL
jgi:hypothetical protein